MMNSLLIVVLCTCISGLTFAVEISSKVDLDSDEECSDTSTDKSSSDALVIVIENSNPAEETTSRSRSSESRPRAGGNVGFRGPSKPVITHSNYPHNLPPTQPKVIKNIYIVVNDKTSASSSPGIIQCKNIVCETTVSTEKDEASNVIGTIHLSVVTQPENVKVEDIPVIDGIHGSGYDRDDRTPTFVSNNEQESPYPHFLYNNIPRIPVYRQDQWRHHLFRSPPASFHSRNYGPRKDSPNWNSRTPGRGSVDDKIEFPLSKSN